MESVNESYWALADKADKKFVRLRDLPPYGGNKWDNYFHKAFQVYTKLWKYQQENRHTLVDAGLKRWEIGEIASRIGQLYYNYYLRTSDATFLSESYIFYEAIVSREYFKDTGKDVALANKHLRFYARFIVVCLLLNRREMAHHLTRQLRTLVDEYRRTFQGNDSKEWKRVVQEISRFMKADAPCQNSRPLRYSVRLDPQPSSFPAVAGLGGRKPLRLKDAVLASYYHNEVKFTELTLDTFRFLQCLEWEPSGSFYRSRVVEQNGAAPGHSGPIRVDDIMDQTLPPNPHKYILYRPSISQLLLVLATACEELPVDCTMLLYLSASGKAPRRSIPPVPTSTSASSSGSDVAFTHMSQSSETTSPVDYGGKAQDIVSESQEGSPATSPLNSPRDHSASTVEIVSGSPNRHGAGLLLGSRGGIGPNYLYPTDILPFTRKPLFIIIDSDNSSVFELIHGEEKGEPAALLLSPIMQPSGEHGFSVDSSSSYQKGGRSYFTFFLTAPFLAFCQLVNVRVTTLAQGVIDQVEKLVTSLIAELAKTLCMSTLDPVWARIMWDPFLRQLLLRFIFCRACLALHRQYGSKQEYLPQCLPPLPKEVMPTEVAVEACVSRVASALKVLDQFSISLSSAEVEKEGNKRLEDQDHLIENRGELVDELRREITVADTN